jgi:predicted dehydrogenase
MALRVGILGLAHGHVGAYCDQWRKTPEHDIQLVAGWDHDAGRAAGAREKYGVEMCDSAEALAARADVEAVVIGAETSLHADLVEIAARAGKAIVLQKPMALTMGQAGRIVAAVRKHGARFTLAWQMRVDPQNVEIKRLVSSSALGRIFMVRRRHGLSTHTWADFGKTWHVKPELNRGMWADDASHAIDFLLWLLGEPRSVMAEIATLHNPKVPDDNGIAIFRYSDGTLAEIVCSFTCLAGENTTEIVGERGVLVQNFGDGPSANAPRPPGGIGLKWLLAGDEKWKISDTPSPANHGPRIAALAPELAKFLHGRRPPICTAEEGRTSLAMTLACYRSAELGRRVEISEILET